MIEKLDLMKRLKFIRSVVRKNPVAADGLLADLARDIGKSTDPKPELRQAEFPDSQYTHIKGSIEGPKA